jgi:hypothetical protein
MLLRRLQKGENIGLPHSRPMLDIGSRCHELRIRDEPKAGAYSKKPDSAQEHRDVSFKVTLLIKKGRKHGEFMPREGRSSGSLSSRGVLGDS